MRNYSFTSSGYDFFVSAAISYVSCGGHVGGHLLCINTFNNLDHRKMSLKVIFGSLFLKRIIWRVLFYS